MGRILLSKNSGVPAFTVCDASGRTAPASRHALNKKTRERGMILSVCRTVRVKLHANKA
jgi:hypothetical protein